jgi:nitrogenase molybdenum-iron protein beta chain
VVKGRVNVLGVVPFQHLFWKGDLATVKRTLARIGVEANVLFTEFQGHENVKALPEAELNVILSPWNGHRVARKLEQRFGTPSLVFPGVPVGPKQTTDLLRGVAEALGLDRERVEAAIREEERHAYRFTEYLGDGLILGLPHAYFAVVADSGTAIGLTKFLVNEIAYLADIVIVTDEPPPERRAEIVRQLTEGLDTVLKPEVVFEADAHVIRQKLKGRSFLFLLASSLEKHLAGEEYGAIHHSVAFPSFDRLVLDRSYAGYRGGLALMEELTSKWAGPL